MKLIRRQGSVLYASTVWNQSQAYWVKVDEENEYGMGLKLPATIFGQKMDH